MVDLAMLRDRSEQGHSPKAAMNSKTYFCYKMDFCLLSAYKRILTCLTLCNDLRLSKGMVFILYNLQFNKLQYQFSFFVHVSSTVPGAEE